MDLHVLGHFRKPITSTIQKKYYKKNNIGVYRTVRLLSDFVQKKFTPRNPYSNIKSTSNSSSTKSNPIQTSQFHEITHENKKIPNFHFEP